MYSDSEIVLGSQGIFFFYHIYELLCNEYLHVRYKAGTVLGTAEITVNKTVLVNTSWR